MAGERTLESLFQAIQDSKNEVIGRLGTIDQSVNRLDNAMGSLVEQFTEIQQRVSKTEDDICDAEKRVKDLEKSVAQLQSKVDYLENKSRQSNLLILGVPELSEGTDCTAFVQRLIPELLGRENFIEPLRVERCHRIGDRQRAERLVQMKVLKYGETWIHDMASVNFLSWAESFEQLLQCKTGVLMFEKHLRTEYSEENLLFYLDCEAFRNLPPESDRKAAARRIFREYVANGAPRQINIDSATRAEISSSLSDPEPECFSRAQRTVYSLMEHDSYPRFIKGSVYQALRHSARSRSRRNTSTSSV
ncbi:hypothetical protein WMY93_032032 [Mugilogobius chulae]|uniref:RGS domain-containing protein n=1 Tax=Mugilogobius chulae TaxID=88201 RepID=A0AAW0MEU7_9GOBI